MSDRTLSMDRTELACLRQEADYNLLVSTSVAIREQRGVGAMVFEDGSESQCSFVIRQFSNADMVVECNHEDDRADHLVAGQPPLPRSISGLTETQQSLTVNGPLSTTHISVGSSGTVTRHTAHGAMLEPPNGSPREIARINFEIVNLFIWPDERREVAPGEFRGLIVLLLGGRELLLRRVPNHDEIRESLRERHGTAVTAILETTITDQNDVPAAIAIVERVCALLSLARGTLVTWVRYEITASDGAPISSYGRNAKTKDCCSAVLIDPNYPRETSGFLHQVYERYGTIESIFEMRRVIDARLDVNESSFLETRALVGSALIEYVASAYAREYGSESDRKASLTEKTEFLATQLNAGFGHEEIRAIGKTRNRLAHRLRFATDKPYAEYAALSNFLNVVLLRLLGYTGSYIDCRSWERRTLL